MTGRAPIPGEDVVRFATEELGFARAGVIACEPSGRADALRGWIAEGKHGEMAWLAETAELREDATRVVPGAVSVIMVADLYEPRAHAADGSGGEAGDAAGGEAEGDCPQGRIARYARGRDYHRVVKRRLHVLCDRLREAYPGETFRAVCDSAPVLEREHAARAGLGWVGKHTLVINPELGSYFVLGGILTTLPITPPAAQRETPDHCGTCTRCIDACPTDAITPYSVDATRCISYLTIEHRGPIDESLHAAMGDWVFGCDVCQEVCPHNSPIRRGSPATRRPEYEPRRGAFDLLGVLGWTEEDRRRAFENSPLKRVKLPVIRRNAVVALTNSAIADARSCSSLSATLERIVGDDAEPVVVRETAADSLRRLSGSGRK